MLLGRGTKKKKKSSCCRQVCAGQEGDLWPSTSRPSESPQSKGSAHCTKLHKDSRKSRGRRAEHLRSDLLIT